MGRSSIVLWLRKNLPDQADRIVSRARHHYHLLQTAGPAVGRGMNKLADA
jgi:hypothetical protein